MRKGRVTSSVAPRAIETRGRAGRSSPHVWSLSRACSPRQETLFLADSSRLRAACLSCPLGSLPRGSFFFFPVLYPPSLFLFHPKVSTLESGLVLSLLSDPLPRFRYPTAFSLSFSPPDVFPYALLAWPWKEKFGIKWVPSTARGIIIHADERNAGPRQLNALSLNAYLLRDPFSLIVAQEGFYLQFRINGIRR